MKYVDKVVDERVYDSSIFCKNFWHTTVNIASNSKFYEMFAKHAKTYEIYTPYPTCKKT